MIATYRKARHEYEVEDTYEAGLVLQGTEVKSLRAGHAVLNDGYVVITKDYDDNAKDDNDDNNG